MKAPDRPTAVPHWPMQLVAMCGSLRDASGAARAELRARLWNLLRDSLLVALARETPAHRPASREDLEDLASAKALDLLSRAERGDWDPAGRSAGEIVLYIRSTARHGLLRLGQQRQRTVSLDDPSSRDPAEDELAPQWSSAVPAPERMAEMREFAMGLVDCLTAMKERARRVWMLRAIHDLSTREIAAHPNVQATTANVDVILMRARASLRDCLTVKGLGPGHLAPGTFTLLWDRVSRAMSNEAVVAEGERA